MTVAQFVAAYALTRDISPITVQYLDHAVRALDRWHGHATKLGELSDGLLNRWLTDRLAAGKSRKTVRVQRGAILCLWRAAFADGLVQTEPQRVKVIRAPLPNPDAWRVDEVANLLRAADAAPGRFTCGLRRADLLRAWLLVGYYCCLRPGDLLWLERGNVAADGTVSLVPRKTGSPLRRYLHPDAMDALAKIKTDSPRLFPVAPKTLRRWWRWLKRESGVQGSPKWLRRTGATHCEIQQPGSAMQALGHKTPGLAYAHYVDCRQLQAKPPTPPPITPTPPGV